MKYISQFRIIESIKSQIEESLFDIKEKDFDITILSESDIYKISISKTSGSFEIFWYFKWEEISNEIRFMISYLSDSKVKFNGIEVKYDHKNSVTGKIDRKDFFVKSIESLESKIKSDLSDDTINKILTIVVYLSHVGDV